ncbi:MAG: transporter substrate-binding domain-containing protein [Candidatus Thiodiazotropha sp.]
MLRTVIHRLILLILICVSPLSLSAGAPPSQDAPDTSDPVTADPDGTLVIAGSWNLPPFSQLDSAGQPTGIGVDIWELWAQRTGRKIRFRLSNLMDSLEDLKQGRADFHMGLYASSQRSEWLTFSKPYLSAPATLYFRPKGDRPTRLADLDGKRIGILGPPPKTLFTQQLPRAEAVVYENIPRMIEAMDQNAIEGFIADRPSTEMILLRQGRRGDFVPLSRDLYQAELRVGVKKTSADLLEVIEQGLDLLTREELEAILSRWLGASIDYGQFLPRYDSVGLSRKEKTWVEQHPVLRIAVDPIFAPYEFIDDQQNHQGISADFLSLLGRRLGLEFRLIPTSDWDHSVQLGYDKQVDLLPMINRTEEREQHLIFTDAYFLSRRVIITRGLRNDLNSEAELAGKRLALPTGYSINEIITRDHPDVTIIEVADIPTALLKVSEGTADATILSIGVAGYWMERSEISNLRITGNYGRPSVLAMAVRNDWPELAAILQKGLDSISDDERQQIRRRWITLNPGEIPSLNNPKVSLDLSVKEWSWLSKHSSIRIGIDPNWEPIEYVTLEGKYRGISSRFMKRLSEIIGIGLSLEPNLTWQQVMQKAESGEIDVLPAVTPSPERMLYLSFTEPYLQSPIMIFNRKNAPLLTGLPELKGQRVAVVKNYVVEENLKRDRPDLDLFTFSTAEQALRALAAGKVDAYVGNLTIGSFLIDNLGLSNLKVAAPTPYNSALSIGVRKDSPELLSILEKALASIGEDERREMRQESLAIRYEVEVNYTLLWQVIGGASVLLLLSFLWLAQTRRQKQALAAAKAEADQANQFKTYFLANMSHEIRTPMNAIVGFGHLALQTELSQRQRHYIEKIQVSANALLNVINDVLDFTKIEAGKLDIEQVAFSLGEVLDNLVSINAIRAEEKGLELLLQQDLQVPDQLIGDPLRLGQVLVNLVSNAIKFTEKGEVTIQVNELEREGERVRLKFSIEDTGIGIPRDQVERLFDAFTQLDGSTTRRYGGSGLGLNISQQLVHLMGGRLEVDSTPGRGSRFSFVLPFHLPQEHEERSWLPAPGMRGLRALVVDDNAMASQILSEMLESFTFDVTSASRAEQALGLVEAADKQAKPFQLVLMDWRLPGLDGVEAGRMIKSELGLSHQPVVILVTAFGREEVMQSAQEAGMDGFLIKPVNPSVLFDAIMQAFNQELSDASRQRTREMTLQALQGEVLLVEDNPINQQVAQEILQLMGLQVSIAGDGYQALARLQEQTFDLVLMDIQMPGMDGYETVRRIRAQARFSGLPVIAMTAHAMSGDREKCLEAGMNDHIAKPIEPSRLHATLHNWLKTSDKPLPVETESPDTPDQPEFPNSLPGIDLAWGLERIGGNRKLFAKLLADFLGHHRDTLQRFKDQLQNNQPEDARRELHTLQGVSGNLGGLELQQAARILESRLLESQDGLLDGEAYQAFAQAFETFIRSLSQLEQDGVITGQDAVKVVKDTDSQDIQPLLERLAEALEEGDPEARNLLTVIEAKLPDDTSQRIFNRMVELIGGYDFDDALVMLDQLKKSLKENKE